MVSGATSTTIGAGLGGALTDSSLASLTLFKVDKEAFHFLFHLSHTLPQCFQLFKHHTYTLIVRSCMQEVVKRKRAKVRDSPLGSQLSPVLQGNSTDKGSFNRGTLKALRIAKKLSSSLSLGKPKVDTFGRSQLDEPQ